MLSCFPVDFSIPIEILFVDGAQHMAWVSYRHYLHRLSSEALCLPQEDAVELERLITMVLNECQTKHEYHKAVEQNLMTSLLFLITRSYTGEEKPISAP